jgi:hypothetical protein
MKPNCIRDYAFVAYLFTSGVKCFKNDDGSFSCQLQDDELNAHFKEYKEKYKPIIDKIRKMIKNM